MDKYQNKYLIQSARLKNWDYGWNGTYFITICTANRECYFGKIEIIRGYKTGVTKYARNNNIGFAWQSRFHDHIIRDNESYQRIRNDIINNPRNWNDDTLNKNLYK